MKSARRLYIMLLLASGSLLWTGCGGSSTPNYPVNAVPEYFHVSLTIAGRSITMNFGRLDINPDHPNLALSPPGTSIFLEGEIARGYSEDQDLALGIYGWLSPQKLPTYVGTYDGTAAARRPRPQERSWRPG